MAAAPLPSIGTRISLQDSLGTIRYTGPIDGTNGLWLGVEWDDPVRGKHDGVKDGKRYFDCLVSGAGSFIRPTAHLDYGRSFLTALVDKYVDLPQGFAGNEFVVLGSSKGAIQVEAVNMDKIRGKFSDLERLREVSLDRERVARADESGSVKERCLNLRAVDLSFSLVPSWDVIALIASELPFLERLVLNNNRFQPFSTSDLNTQLFQRLTELQLSGTLMSWQAMLDVIARMPALKHLEMGYNRLSTLDSDQSGGPEGTGLELINFDSNQLSHWDGICHSLRSMKQLERVILSGNTFSIIPSAEEMGHSIESLPWRFLSLSSTRISSWASVDALSAWCPRLEGLSLYGTPLVDNPENARVWRQVAVARLPSLRILDGAPVSARQRSDAELFYISMVARIEYKSEEERYRAHPRWNVLCQKYGTTAEALPAAPKGETLSSRLIRAARLISGSTPPTNAASFPAPTTTRVLPTMPLRLVRLKLLKVLKAPRGVTAELWKRMADDSFSRIGDSDGSDDAREIEWWVDDGDEVVVCVL
ncbi:hypothetical protein K488DRAFT_49021 [Vararia minispora EC-137]|uniref:Uncharacterized protein n=1 Tax=Vararia minispora EC-137 TaxID=1314806 RepID=A0ACB8QLV6_9AGAM|nr:hypothetical protein K488DRAFT_49021 [Vararia minispora EC-137]